MNYKEFIRSKQISAMPHGFNVDKSTLNKNAFEWQKDVEQWALKKGKCALFLECGLGKSILQLMWGGQVVQHTNKPVLILAPLAVVQQTVREAKKFGERAIAVREQQEITKPDVYIANYEIIEHFDMSVFAGIVLDESSILKDFTSKTRTQLIDLCKSIPYRLCCTATPSPNDYTEIGNHAEFLGIMSRTEMLATFFVHDGGNTSQWRLKGHAKDSFFEWVSSWACCMNTPADLGYDGSQYILPKLTIHEHIVTVNQLEDADGQSLLYAPTVQTLNERRAARRNSMTDRVNLAAEIANGSDEQCLIWCDLNDESAMLSKCVAQSVEVKGSDSPEYKVESILNFTENKVKALVSKPSIAGMGINAQSCHRMIFVGLSDSFESYYQAVRRCWRFGQEKPVDVHIIISDAEGAVKANIERKQADAERLTKELVKHTKDILRDDIQATTRIVETYFATEKMIVPEWIKKEF